MKATIYVFASIFAVNVQAVSLRLYLPQDQTQFGDCSHYFDSLHAIVAFEMI